MTALWTHDPATLFEVHKLGKPYDATEGDDARSYRVERTNAHARFVVWWVLLASAVSALAGQAHLIRYYVLVGGCALFGLSFVGDGTDDALERDHVFADFAHHKFCQAPNDDNPLANPSAGHHYDKLPSCPLGAVKAAVHDSIRGGSSALATIYKDASTEEKRRSVDTSTRMLDRAFYSVPGSTVPSNRENFTHALFGDGLRRTLYHGI